MTAATTTDTTPRILTRPYQRDEDFWRVRNLLTATYPITPPADAGMAGTATERTRPGIPAGRDWFTTSSLSERTGLSAGRAVVDL